MNIDDVIGAAHLPEKTIPLTLRGDLQARWEELERRRQTAQDAEGDSLAGSGEARELAEEMDAIAAEMRESQVVFLFRGLGTRAYSDLLAAHRVPEDKRTDDTDGIDWQTWPAALIAASAVDPAMTVEQAEKLCEKITNGQWDELFATAFQVNRSKVNVPFSLGASAIKGASAPRSKPPAPGESLADVGTGGSLAG